MEFRTRAIHAGNPCDASTGAVVQPIHFASTFAQHVAGEWREYDYSRSGNPTRKAFEITLGALEGGTDALAFSSGMAAIHCVTMLLAPGDRIIAGSDVYGGTYRLLHRVCTAQGVEVELVPSVNLAAVERALEKPAKLLWLESPGNPLLSISDLAACAELAHKRGVLLGVDSTFATPVLTRPLELGADIVMHSATKYIGGHSDVLGGALVVRDPELREKLYFIQNATGAVMGPLESYLCSRGLKTLELRVREQCRTALDLARRLDADRRVRKVYYPGLETHPGHKLAARQMDRGFGAMISFELDADFAAAKRFVQSTELFHLAVSLGAVESLIEQPASMSHASYSSEDRQKFGLSDSLVRLSIGLEAPDDLWNDLDQALGKA